MRLTKYEKETIILFNESGDEASIYTYNPGLKTRLKKIQQRVPTVLPFKGKE